MPINVNDPEYVKVIEDLGGLVVTDSLCFGTRYFWENIDESLDPMEGITKRYLSKASCPRMTDRHAERANFMMDLIKEFNVEGVILQMAKFNSGHE